MNKTTCVIYAPVDTYSGYGANARDKVKAIIELKKNEWDIKIISCRWGDTPLNFCSENKEWEFLKEYMLVTPQLPSQPEIMIWITVPNEVQAMGKWNCLITAGIESDIAVPEWIEGINRMDLTLVSSNHSKTVFENSIFEKRNQQGVVEGIVKVQKPIEVVFEGVSLETYFPKENSEFNLENIKEDFCYLFLGHWMDGDFGEDRKNVSLLVKAFYEENMDKLKK